jgi:hypothetical protein
MERRRKAAFLTVTILATGSLSAHAGISFEETTSAAGIDYVGKSWGAAWGDFNGDSLPDVYVPNHLNPPSLYVNQGDGTFTDVASAVIPEIGQDKHGAIWNDFDGDGDEDLYQTIDGGGEPSALLENIEGTTFQNIAAQVGVDFPEGRGRMPVWLDADRDSLIDLLAISGGKGLTRLWRQNPPTFEDFTGTAGFGTNDGPFNGAWLADIDLDGSVELILRRESAFPGVVLKTSSVPFQDISGGFPNVFKAVDAAIGDFDGDLLPDAYVVQGTVASEILQVDEFLVETALEPRRGEVQGADLLSPGSLTFLFEPRWQILSTETPILVGSAEMQVTAREITLDPADPATHGMPAFDPDTASGVFIGYDPETGIWRFRAADLSYTLNTVITAEVAIDQIEIIGIDPLETPENDVLYVHDGTTWVDRAADAGVGTPSWGRSVVAQDFDNDMDLDIYIVATGKTRNRENILYENQGAGTFVKVAGGGGAPGDVQGRGDAVATADYDGDGYIDLFIVNGRSKDPYDLDGRSQLYRNTGAGNNWLKVDLEGRFGSPNELGAKVYVTAGSVRQIRTQDGGFHFKAQNHRTLHFGLGSNTSAELVEVHWPGGTVTRLFDVAGNQTVRVAEQSDQDADGLTDDTDNCLLVANADQADADGDGFGNLCDGDFNNDCTVNRTDARILIRGAGTAAPALDLDGSGRVDAGDWAIFVDLFGRPPGPSGVADCGGTP